tara:strand:+ start:115 stop:471 length:357 start_codon:yes stop_codon:yes gene_type:complete
MAKTVSNDVQKLTECISDFFNVGAEDIGSRYEGKNNKNDLAVDLAAFIAARFNGTELYLRIDSQRIERNLKILDLRQRKKYTLKRIADILNISTTTVHSVVMNPRTVIITGDFDEPKN